MTIPVRTVNVTDHFYFNLHLLTPIDDKVSFCHDLNDLGLICRTRFELYFASAKKALFVVLVQLNSNTTGFASLRHNWNCCKGSEF